MKIQFKKYSFFICYLICLLGTIKSNDIFGQKGNFNFQNINTEHGLSENTVLDIIEDTYGYIWFATENGLTKFDGINCTVYRNNHDDINSLTGDEIQSLCINGDELLIATINPTTISAFNLKTKKFRAILRYNELEVDEYAYFLNNESYTLLITHRDKYIYDQEKKKFEIFSALKDQIDKVQKKYNSGKSQLNSENFLEKYYLDKNNKLIAYCLNVGIFEISLPKLTYKELINNQDFKKLYGDINLDKFSTAYIFRDEEQRIWFNIKDHTLGYFNQNNNTFQTKYANAYIKDIFEDPDSNIWIGSETGLLFYEADEDSLYNIYHKPTDKHSLSNNYISSVYISKDKMLWVGHDAGGVDYAKYFNISRFQHISVQSSNSLLSDKITGICESKNENEVWISSTGGINKWDLKNDKYYSYLNNQYIISIYCDINDNVWCLNSNEEILVKQKNEKKFKKPGFIENHLNYYGQERASLIFFEDRKNRMWLVGNGLYQINFKERTIVKNNVCSQIQSASSIEEDKSGNFWITGNNDKLIVINPDRLTCHHYHSDINDPYSLNSNILWDAHIDGYNNLWIATNKGINKTKIKDYIIGDQLNFESFKLKDGLNDEIVFRFIEDNSNNLWFATNNGLSKKVDKHKSSRDESGFAQEFINYNKFDGLASGSIGCFTDNKITCLCGTKLTNGEILLGSNNGITKFDPKYFTGDNYHPPLYITDLKIFNKTVPIGKYQNRTILSKSVEISNDIQLSYKDRVFSFDFITLDYTNSRSNQYEYKLEGFDDEWIFLGNKRVVTFTNIPGGTYTLRIRASNNEGYYYNEEASLNLSIKPPFWETWVFRIFGLSIFIGVLVLFYKMRTYQIKKQKNRLKYLVNQRTQEIKKSNIQLEIQTKRLKETNIELEEKKKKLEQQSVKLQVYNNNLVKQKTELEKLNKKVKRIYQERINFFTNISHELRTPLSLILGPVDHILSHEKITSNVNHHLKIIERNTNRLLTLINQLLDFRKLETDHMKLEVAEGHYVTAKGRVYRSDFGDFEYLMVEEVVIENGTN